MPDRPTGYEPLLTLKSVAPGLWICDGPLISFYGLTFPTRMTLVALEGGGLFVHSPVALSPALLAELRALEALAGPVAHLIAPNWIHYAHIPAWQQAFPEALTHAAPKVEARAADYGLPLKVDHPLGDAAPEAWAGQLDQLLVRGSDVHQGLTLPPDDGPSGGFNKGGPRWPASDARIRQSSSKKPYA